VRRVPLWWQRVKVASGAWLAKAREEGIPEEVVEWSSRVTNLTLTHEAGLWLARMASKQPPELSPEHDGKKAAEILAAWHSFGNVTGRDIDTFQSVAELEAVLEQAKEHTLKPDIGGWNTRRHTFAEYMKPWAAYKVGGDVYACYVLNGATAGHMETLATITHYCVRREFGHSRHTCIPDIYYLVTRNGSVMSLIHPQSNQNKGPKDDELTGCEAVIALIVASGAISGSSDNNSWVENSIAKHMKNCKSGSLGAILNLSYQIGKAGDMVAEKLDKALFSSQNPSAAMVLVLAQEQGTLPKNLRVEEMLKNATESVYDIRFDIQGMLTHIQDDMEAVFRSILWMHAAFTRRKEPAAATRLSRLAQSINTVLPTILETNSHRIATQVDLKTFIKLKQLIEKMGSGVMSKQVSDTMLKIEHFYMAMRAKHVGERLQKDHHEAPMLASANIHTLMWYYAHMARGKTVANQQPNSGKPWLELEKKMVGIAGAEPNVARNMLRHYLDMVKDPAERLAGMAEMAGEGSQLVLSLAPREYAAQVEAGAGR
jgi:hypothetical protein